jgi:hypothetical protein
MNFCPAAFSKQKKYHTGMALMNSDTFFTNLQFQFIKGTNEFLCLFCNTVNLENNREKITNNILFTKPTRDYFVIANDRVYRQEL